MQDKKIYMKGFRGEGRGGGGEGTEKEACLLLVLYVLTWVRIQDCEHIDASRVRLIGHMTSREIIWSPFHKNNSHYARTHDNNYHKFT